MDESKGFKNDFEHTIPLIVISHLAKGHVYASSKDYIALLGSGHLAKGIRAESEYTQWFLE